LASRRKFREASAFLWLMKFVVLAKYLPSSPHSGHKHVTPNAGPLLEYSVMEILHRCSLNKKDEFTTYKAKSANTLV
jgi:hypothetical protein